MKITVRDYSTWYKHGQLPRKNVGESSASNLVRVPPQYSEATYAATATQNQL